MCSVYYGRTARTRTPNRHREDETPRRLRSRPRASSRAPDSSGWFNHPLSVAFAGPDATSGIASCTQPDLWRRRQRGRLRSPERAPTSPATRAPRQASASSTTQPHPPSPRRRTASRTRRAGTGSLSRSPSRGRTPPPGIAGCTAPTRYAGPDLAKASVVGACRDAAGNTAEAGQAFQYDATAPKLPMAKAEVEKGVAKIVWKRSPDAVLVELERSPGVNGRKKTIVYRGNGASFIDRTVRDGVRYRYEIRASDVAGNVVEKAVTANVDLRRCTGPRPARPCTHRSSSPGRPSRERPSTTSSSTGTR